MNTSFCIIRQKGRACYNCNMYKMTCPAFILEALNILNQHHFQAFLVGGCVRDQLLGIEPKDYDITTNARPEEIEALFEETIPTGKKHGTITVLLQEPIEITTYRTESDYKDHRHPNQVYFVDELEQDLARRDFTINAMAYHPNVGLVDPFGGKKDLKEGIIRTVGNPYQRFSEDALRMFRAHRFAARFHFRIEENTALAIQACSSSISCVSSERVRSELLEILQTNPYQIEKMTQLLSHWMPELELCRTCEQTTPYHDTNVLHHILRACALLKPYDETCMYALFFHDLAKPACKTTSDGADHFRGHPVLGQEIAKRLCEDFKLTKQQQKEIPLLVRYHDEKMNDPYQFIEKLCLKEGMDDAWMQKLFRVKYCDIMAHSSYGQQTIQVLNHQIEVYEECKRNRPFALKDLNISGKDLLNYPKIRKEQIKGILKEILLMCFRNPEKNQREELLEYIQCKYS